MSTNSEKIIELAKALTAVTNEFSAKEAVAVPVLLLGVSMYYSSVLLNILKMLPASVSEDTVETIATTREQTEKLMEFILRKATEEKKPTIIT